MTAPTNWTSFPFSVDGVDFVSLINPASSMHKTVMAVPPSVFVMMNQSAIRELVGKVSLMSKPEIQEELDRVNEGYSSAYLALA